MDEPEAGADTLWLEAWCCLGYVNPSHSSESVACGEEQEEGLASGQLSSRLRLG